MNVEPNGQILPASRFGSMLTALAKTVDTIVEIGTWNGGGSTLCLAMGLERPEQRIYTVEVDRTMRDTARARYSDDRIVFIHGTVSPMNDSTIIIDQLPSEIDLLLIDGGDGNGSRDLELLWERTEIIALDDTREQKNSGNRRFLIGQHWIELADVQNERNGWSIFKRPPKGT